MFCKNCGNEIKDGVEFCDKCGTTVKQNSIAWGTNNIVVENQPKKSNLKKYIICFAVIILVLVFILRKCRNSFAEPAIKINSIELSASWGYIEYEFKNISDKDIAYIEFETYFYDKMGSALEDYDMTVKYTGPLYKGDIDTTIGNCSRALPSSTAVVYPKYITVTFTDDEEITFENDFYFKSDDFYGGKLKDK